MGRDCSSAPPLPYSNFVLGNGRDTIPPMHITRPVYQAMLAHLQAVYPLEGCGILAGTGATAVHHYAIPNIRHSPVAYEMDPYRQIEAMLELENKGWQMVAIYHSHPGGPAHPSPTDVAQAYYPEAAQVIVSLADRQRPLTRAFCIADGRYTEIPLLIE
jgi:[CysO sulfur-carrier protein]-S-L-cysteine hydrolase